MLLSYNWLKKFVNIPKSIIPEKLGELLTMATVEVESIKNQGELLDKVVVGKLVKLEAHPNADKLKVAHVNIGGFKNPKSEILNPKQIQSSKLKIQKVVCGGVNLNEGMLVA
ncbi:hypothetical protein L6279_02310, partial [Candidatus Parcubacteria bacterium]|nr:hypothetical protein [Candidatus Parcubacteria bacterium]